MLRVSKEIFEVAVRAARPDLVDEFLEPDVQGGDQQFLVHEGTLLSLALRPDQKLIWITGVLGRGMTWVWELQRFGLHNGYEWLGFKVKQELPWGKAIVRFSKAQLMASTPTGDEYCTSLRAR